MPDIAGLCLAAAAEGGGLPEFLTPQLQVVVWSVIVFFSLLALLWKFAWGPIMQALEQREQNIQKKIDDAEGRFKEADAKAAEYERRINAAKDEAVAIIAAGKRDTEKVKEEMLAEANKEAGRTLERAKREIQLAQEAAVHEIRKQVVKLSAEISARVIEREINEQDQRRFIEEALGKIETPGA